MSKRSILLFKKMAESPEGKKRTLSKITYRVRRDLAHLDEVNYILSRASFEFSVSNRAASKVMSIIDTAKKDLWENYYMDVKRLIK